MAAGRPSGLYYTDGWPVDRDDNMTERMDDGVERLAASLRQIASRADELIEAVRKESGERYHASIRRLERQLRRTPRHDGRPPAR